MSEQKEAEFVSFPETQKKHIAVMIYAGMLEDHTGTDGAAEALIKSVACLSKGNLKGTKHYSTVMKETNCDPPKHFLNYKPHFHLEEKVTTPRVEYGTPFVIEGGSKNKVNLRMKDIVAACGITVDNVEEISNLCTDLCSQIQEGRNAMNSVKTGKYMEGSTVKTFPYDSAYLPWQQNNNKLNFVADSATNNNCAPIWSVVNAAKRLSDSNLKSEVRDVMTKKLLRFGPQMKEVALSRAFQTSTVEQQHKEIIKCIATHGEMIFWERKSMIHPRYFFMKKVTGGEDVPCTMLEALYLMIEECKKRYDHFMEVLGAMGVVHLPIAFLNVLIEEEFFPREIQMAKWEESKDLAKAKPADDDDVFHWEKLPGFTIQAWPKITRKGGEEVITFGQRVFTSACKSAPVSKKGLEQLKAALNLRGGMSEDDKKKAINNETGVEVDVQKVADGTVVKATILPDVGYQTWNKETQAKRKREAEESKKRATEASLKAAKKAAAKKAAMDEYGKQQAPYRGGKKIRISNFIEQIADMTKTGKWGYYLGTWAADERGILVDFIRGHYPNANEDTHWDRLVKATGVDKEAWLGWIGGGEFAENTDTGTKIKKARKEATTTGKMDWS